MDARRRVYLTATLAANSILVTDLNADAESIAKVITPGSATHLVDRMILAPGALNPQLITDDAVRLLAYQFAHGERNGDGIPNSEPINVVAPVPSIREAEAWRPPTFRIHTGDTLHQAVDDLRAGHVGLLVLVNKVRRHRSTGLCLRAAGPRRRARPSDAFERCEGADLPRFARST